MDKYYQKLKGWSKHNTFGLRQEWLKLYLDYPDEWENKGCLGNKQVEALRVWLRTAGLQDLQGKETFLSAVFHRNGIENPFTWELLWTEVVFNFAVAEWYVRKLGIGCWTTTEMKDHLHMNCPHLAFRTAGNAIVELASFLERTPVGGDLRQGKVSSLKPRSIERSGLPFPSEAAILYALCKMFSRERREALDVQEDLLWPWKVFGCEANFVFQKVAFEYVKWLEMSDSLIQLRHPVEEVIRCGFMPIISR